jgi:uncharacterized membrane protein YeaQ/YmgE (transglycosylase-associated protein family)
LGREWIAGYIPGIYPAWKTEAMRNAFRGPPIESGLNFEDYGPRYSSLMSLLLTLFIGFAVGLIAKLVMPGRHPGGFIVTLVLGVAGALIGGYVAGSSGVLIYSFIGAVLFVALYRVFLYRILSWLTGKPGKKPETVSTR